MSDEFLTIGWGAGGGAIVFLVATAMSFDSVLTARRPNWQQYLYATLIGLGVYAAVGAVVATAFSNARSAAFVAGMAAVAFVALFVER